MFGIHREATLPYRTSLRKLRRLAPLFRPIVRGRGGGDSWLMRSRSSGVIGTSSERSEGSSCSRLRAPRMGAVIAGWLPTHATAKLAG
jgi:hypothetical protein